jgi:hypothetical protein
MPLNPQRCSADERNHSRKPVQTLQVLMASVLWRVLSAASLFEFVAQDASLFAVVRPFVHLGFDALVRQIANALLKFPSRVISHRCSPVSRASRPGRRTDERSSDSIRTITDRMAGHPKSDRSRACLCADGLRSHVGLPSFDRRCLLVGPKLCNTIANR